MIITLAASAAPFIDVLSAVAAEQDAARSDARADVTNEIIPPHPRSAS